MALFKRKNEKRSTPPIVGEQEGESWLKQLLASEFTPDSVSRSIAMQIPTISGAIDLIANTIAGTPIKLYRDDNGKAVEVTDDNRVKLLNDDTGDTLTPNEFWRAMITDYFLGKGGYAYIEKDINGFTGLYYVGTEYISFLENNDPIHKDYKILVNGTEYYPWDFLRILRRTTNGMYGTSIVKDHSQLIAAAYRSLLLEQSMARRGGNKKGFFKSSHNLGERAFDKFKKDIEVMYSNSDSDMQKPIVFNDGVAFESMTSTAAELQLNENKRVNAQEFARIFHVSPDVIEGKVKDSDGLIKLACIPIMVTIQCALNRDFLLEREKKDYYWAFDTKELLKGSMKDRFEAYKTALEANFMDLDEVRYMEDLPTWNIPWIKLNLKDVLYNPKTGEVYTPNTGLTANINEASTVIGENDGEGGENEDENTNEGGDQS